MHKKYLDLFTELTRATATAAEQVMDYDKTLEDEDGYEKAKALRDDFEKLNDKLTAEEFDGTLDKADFAKLLIGAYVITNNLRDKITILKKSIDGYEKDLMPKLQEIIDSNDEDVMDVANKILIIDSNE